MQIKMDKKIFIIFHNKELIDNVIESIFEISEDVNISKKFTTDKDANEPGFYYLNQEEVNLALKNNSLLSVVTTEYISEGITIDDLYNNDLFFMSYKEYNMINDKIFNNNNILTIWIDSKYNKPENYTKREFYYEIECLEQRLENINYEYFMDDEPQEIASFIINSLNND